MDPSVDDEERRSGERLGDVDEDEEARRSWGDEERRDVRRGWLGRVE